MEQKQLGVFYAAFAYFLWGILPLYWKLLHHVRAEEILAHRMIWSFLFMLILLGIQKQWQTFFALLRQAFIQPKQMFIIFVASVLISANWFIYIWAVNHDHMIEASLGYYINPLLSVLLGVIVLKEKLNRWQVLSFFLALVGVLIMTVQHGKFPWIALSLAFSFAVYGLVKKLTNFDSSIGLTMETMIIAPISVLYVVYLHLKGMNTFSPSSLHSMLLLIGAGPATALPLLYFAKGAKQISLTLLGFLQYIAPSLSLILGVFLFHEPFTNTHVYSFSFIWSALLIFSFSKMLPERKEKSLRV
ncbi:chloramphenicol-sensitive protein RarD [Thermolongibacillus altinsuensis]|jgi:chloramphenicol-sensitive protein RarD|uniref:Chloramphenicol-sensitive protein RarD n=1 Tax=Thermolongibacillus altinsuensis TaxID=575256 RepID=A0A4R1QDT7_9BACL|nr:EamA family transporter RarD [Thermolongibacillus altinsuensis]TCL49722.1 chloramphenicol-sensitive protein RarD [Thermolongibacillus altinsuensis]GMB08335.1 transporter [Thermolongibacillus altinsuensis]